MKCVMKKMGSKRKEIIDESMNIELGGPHGTKRSKYKEEGEKRWS